MKKILIIIFISLSAVAIAQKKNLIVEGTPSALYISHKVAAGESLFSLARKYNQSVQAIATFNNLPADKGLLLGQTIKVPLTAQNLASPGEDSGGQTSVPLYHIVGKNETLFRISTNMSVALPEVKQWNNLSTDNIAAGTPLIVGHLKLANKQATLAKNNNETTAVNTATTKADTLKEVKKEEPVAANANEPNTTTAAPAAKTEEKKEEPVAPTPATEVKQEAPVASTKTEEKKEEPNVAKSETPVTPALQNNEPTLPKATQQESAPIKNETKKLDLLAPEPEVSGEGIFSALYSSDVAQKSLVNKVGEAATFKSTSGWQDKKYYVLMNDVVPGTILKISSVDNKYVFAKVLGNMPEMKENKGLLLRLSNAAATYLGIVDAKFPVQVTFYQ